MSHAHLSVPVGDADHVQGPDNAPVTLVEYGDYECSYCGDAYLVVKQLQQQLGDQLRVVFRNFPLAQMHPHAEHAAEAAEAAAAQNRFWPMHDQLYEHQQALGDQDLARYAGALGLDQAAFTAALHEHQYAEKVHQDFMGGVHSGVNGTPTFYINGTRHDGSFDYDALLAAVERAAQNAA